MASYNGGSGLSQVEGVTLLISSSYAFFLTQFLISAPAIIESNLYFCELQGL